ncbi:DUF6333 family protein [Streptomyces sp. NBC_01789]|uniref:DUF6333 family protein n=1 Tax=Streptomyces sp. NBC_01789 TaxID=2975941 RepID=UPI0022542B96|nr:DUF6333 family protein [Streptomyces sp. NBC_01789]MCX4447727.1 DUF6333 family protein [Streptomyces sp. NBC_01789]
MSYDEVWEYGPDEELAQHGEFRLTVVGPPFPGGDGELPAHDPARAADLVAALGTVDAVVGEEGRIEAVERPSFATRADLDLVAVGCWGPVSEVDDPALAAGGDGSALAEQADALAARFPGAAVIGSVRVDHSVAYSAHVVQHPHGARLFAAGWSGEGDWDREGGVAEVAGAFGIDAAGLRDAGIDPDAEPGDLAWESLIRLVLRRTSPLPRAGRTLSVFRVRRSEGTAGDLEDTWIGEPDGF